MEAIDDAVKKFGLYHKHVLEQMIQEVQAVPQQDPVAKFLGKEPPKPLIFSKRANGLNDLLKRAAKLAKETNEVWEQINNKCTHADQDLEFAVYYNEDTLGNGSDHVDYRLFCTACKKTILNKHI